MPALETVTVIREVSAPRPKRLLLAEQTAFTLVANAVYVYRQHFGVILSCSVLPFLPFLLLLPTFVPGVVTPETAAELALVSLVLFYLGLFVVQGALTVVLSDVCLGNVPKLTRAFGRILRRGRWWHVFTTSMLIGLSAMLGLVVVVVGFVWVFVRSMFAVTVVVLEGRRNRDAIRRSFALTKGQAWRIVGLWLLTFLLAELVALAVGTAVGGLTAVMNVSPVVAALATMSTSFAVFVLYLPLGAMIGVFLYYDQRVRRESYDAQSLSEDLMR